MPVFAIAALAAAAVQLGVSIYGHLSANGKKKQADEILAKAGGSFDNITVPELEQITAETLGPTEFAKINMDPQLRQDQLDALAKTKAITDGGGLDATDRANLNQINNQVAQQASGQRKLIQENMAARGMGGSGSELAAQLSNSQAAANRLQQGGLNTAAQAQQRALQAIQAQSQMAGQLRSQDWGEKAQAAAAQDAINKFNLGHRYEVQQYNNQLRQNDYNNQLGLAQARYGVAQDRANTLTGQAAQSQQFWGQVGAGVGQTINGAGKYANLPSQAPAGGSQYSAGSGNAQNPYDFDPNQYYWDMTQTPNYNVGSGNG